MGGGGLAWSKGRKEEEARVDGHHILPGYIYTPTLLGHHILPVYTYTPTLLSHCILPPRAVTLTKSSIHISSVVTIYVVTIYNTRTRISW